MKVLLAYPSKMVADGLSCLLSSATSVESVDHAYDRDTAIERMRLDKPTVVVVHCSFLGADKQDYVRLLKAAGPESSIIVLANSASKDEFLNLMEAGASGYIGLDCTGSQFVEGVLKVGNGEVAIFGIDAKSRTKAAEAGDSRSTKLENLTPREKEILGLLSHGFSNKQIAENLYVSEHTVRTHVQNLRSKLNVRSKFQAAMLLMQAGQGSANASSMRF
ncbi:MAG: LuxR C-terminal-related transcriptional regulator [Actinomycetota bacterium]|nr:response regulator transcription factor [Actinomycetota bacterium]